VPCKNDLGDKKQTARNRILREVAEQSNIDRFIRVVGDDKKCALCGGTFAHAGKKKREGIEIHLREMVCYYYTKERKLLVTAEDWEQYGDKFLKEFNSRRGAPRACERRNAPEAAEEAEGEAEDGGDAGNENGGEAT
jgi:hypothetical protein